MELSDIFGDHTDFSNLEVDSYRLNLVLTSGLETHTVINNNCSIEEPPKTYMVAINTTIGMTKNGHELTTNGSRQFTDRILKDAPNRIKYKYGNGRTHTTFSWENESIDYLINYVYAHSFGQVIDVTENKANSSTSLTIEHENGTKTTYKYLNPDEIYVSVGEWVDENTMIGQISRSYRSIVVEAVDKDGNSVNIENYLNCDFTTSDPIDTSTETMIESETEVGEISPSDISFELSNNIDSLLKITQNNHDGINDFNEECNRFVKAQLDYLKIVPYSESPNAGGRIWCSKVTDGQISSYGYTAHKITGSNALDKLLEERSQPIYNVVISCGSSGWGHVCYINAIEDGKLFFTRA